MESTRRNQIFTIAGILILLIIAFALIVWTLNRNNAKSTSTAEPTPVSNLADESYISYDLPKDWSEQRCDASAGVVFLLPPQTENFSCDTNRSAAPITITKDSAKTTSCDQLVNQPNATNHSCSEITIDGHKTIYASTTYSGAAEFASNTTITSYFVETDRGVAAITYTDLGGGDYQALFKTFAESAKVKN